MKKFFKRVLPELFVACAVLLILWKVIGYWRFQTEPEMASESSVAVHFLDVGQGMATLVESDGRYMLADGGGYESADKVLSYLDAEGVEKLDYLVISHYDLDHLFGAVRVLEEFDVGQVLCPDYEVDSSTYHRFIEKGSQFVYHPQVGERFELGTCAFTVVSPVRLDYPEENNRSLGIRLVCREVSFLMMGDAELESEYEVCDSNLTLKSTVYLVNHHGSGSSSSQQLLKTVRPEYAVISCGENNDYGHPAESVMKRLAELGVEVYRTDLQGTIIATSDGERIEWVVEHEETFTGD